MPSPPVPPVSDPCTSQTGTGPFMAYCPGGGGTTQYISPPDPAAGATLTIDSNGTIYWDTTGEMAVRVLEQSAHLEKLAKALHPHLKKLAKKGE